MYNYYLHWKYWLEEMQWEIYVVVAILVIICIWVYNLYRGKSGTWSTISDKNKEDISPFVCEIGESKGEYECRRCLYSLFNKPFTKIRNIYNPITQKYLELDCYNDELKLAIEYQGKQHYKYTPHFHKNFESFRNMQYRDELKKIYCKQLGITLVEVPYTVKDTDIEKFLYNKLFMSKYNTELTESRIII